MTELEGLNIAGGLSIGAIFGFAYLHYAWYTRDDVPKGSRTFFNTHVKIKGLVSILTADGGLATIAAFTPVPATFSMYSLAGTACVGALGIIYFGISGFLSGYQTEVNPGQKLSFGLRCAQRSFMSGTPAVETLLDERNQYIHEASKLALLQLAHDTAEMVQFPSHTYDDAKEFRTAFESLFALVLANFFQHGDPQHPEFCATYYLWDQPNRQFNRIVRRSGDGHYHAGEPSRLDERSFAYAALKQGRILVFPRDLPISGLRGVYPPLKKNKGKRTREFIVIPVPPDENLVPGKRLGVVCIDTSRKGCWQFKDQFHMELLKWTAALIHQLASAYPKA